MKNKFKTQVEVQGTKKLGSVKGVQALSFEEMKQTEGGLLWGLINRVSVKIFNFTILEYSDNGGWQTDLW